MVLMLGYDAETLPRLDPDQMLEHSALKELDHDGTLFNEDTIAA